MYIKVTNMRDFTTMISTCTYNGTEDIRVFFNNNTDKLYVSFKFVLFTPLYQSVYSGRLLRADFHSEFNLLTETQDQSKHRFNIHVFDKIEIEPNYITVEKELKII